jgi:hypothetical protein
MVDYVVYLAAQRQTFDRTQEALPDAPIVPTRLAARVVRRPSLVRQRVSAALRYLADLIEPAPECARPALGPC